MFPGRNCLIHGSYGIGKITIVKIVGLLMRERVVEIPTERLEHEEINKLLFEYMEGSVEKNMMIVMRAPSLAWLGEIEKKFAHPLESITLEEKGLAFQNVVTAIEGYDRRGKSFETQIKDYINATLRKLLFVVLSNE